MLSRVSKDDWNKLILQWEDECSHYGENYSDFATASLPVLEHLAYSAPLRDASVYGLVQDDKYQVVCQANSTFLPGYQGKVLRVRHIGLSPRFEFSETVDLQDYTTSLIGVFTGALEVAQQDMPADHIKFHLKSPAERAFGNAFTDALEDHDAFTSVAMKGSWIYLSKT